MRDHKEIGYALMRATMGVVFFFYGFEKFKGGVGNFVAGEQQEFADKLPSALVTSFSYALPFAEVVIGGLLILGLFNTIALALAGLLMMALIFGVVMIPQPQVVANNTVFALVIFALQWLAEYNRYSLDRVIRGKPSR